MDKILIVEDDIHISEMLCELLTRSGYAVTQAFSGTEALLCFESKAFDLVLLDLMLPGKSGAQVLAELRTKSDVPVLMLTAVSDKETTAQLLRHGADDYLTKPFDNGELLARIDARLRRTHAPRPLRRRYATKYAIIHQGRLVKSLTRAELSEECKRALAVTVDDAAKAAVILETKLNIREYKHIGANELRIYERLDDPAEAAFQLNRGGVRVASMHEVGDSLEDYFTKVIGGESK